MRLTYRASRLSAAVAGLVIGFGAALVTALPARAAVEELAEPEVRTVTACDGTYVFFSSDAQLAWSVTAGGETVWPKDGDQQPAPGETGVAFVPFEAGSFSVTYEGAGEGWPKTPDIGHVEQCDLLLEPSATQPTCDGATGQVIIPDLFAKFDPDSVRLDEVLITLDDSAVENDSVHAVAAGTHTVRLILKDDEYPTEITLKTWVLELTAPACPRLPETGSRTGLLAGTAAALIALGSGLFLFGRRRREAAG